MNQHQELVELRKENRLLRERLEGKPITEAEKRLLRIAKGIIAEIGEGADSSDVGEGTGQAHILYQALPKPNRIIVKPITNA